ncbi:MAG: hypothetical protein V1792_01500 [Pseudomonadota bacterium]
MSYSQERQQQRDQRQGFPKRIQLEDDGYCVNGVMVEMSPFDISMLLGKIHAVMDGNGQAQLVKNYERQIYLSHLQARSLLNALGKGLINLSQVAEQTPACGFKAGRRSREELTGSLSL